MAQWLLHESLCSMVHGHSSALLLHHSAHSSNGLQLGIVRTFLHSFSKSAASVNRQGRVAATKYWTTIRAQPGLSGSIDDPKSPEHIKYKFQALLAVLGVDQEVLADILRRDPELVLVPCEDVAAALLHFKVAMPSLDVLELVRRKPSLLRIQNAVRVVERSIRDIEALMPALPVRERLLQGQLWLTFRERMQYWEQVDAVADRPAILYVSVEEAPQ